jgi:hypothetical protein
VERHPDRIGPGDLVGGAGPHCPEQAERPQTVGSGHVSGLHRGRYRLKDGFVEVKFKPISGREDQAGGLIWRARDPNNYYVARANALENNVTIYHTVNGRRTEAKRTRMINNYLLPFEISRQFHLTD